MIVFFSEKHKKESNNIFMKIKWYLFKKKIIFLRIIHYKNDYSSFHLKNKINYIEISTEKIYNFLLTGTIVELIEKTFTRD